MDTTDLWRNKKNKKLYAVMCEGVNTTNDRDGVPMTAYVSNTGSKQFYFRETKEFLEKFEKISIKNK